MAPRGRSSTRRNSNFVGRHDIGAIIPAAPSPPVDGPGIRRNMTDSSSRRHPRDRTRADAWLRLAALVLAAVPSASRSTASTPMPRSLVAAVLIFCGRLDTRPGRWLVGRRRGGRRRRPALAGRARRRSSKGSTYSCRSRRATSSSASCRAKSTARSRPSSTRSIRRGALQAGLHRLLAGRGEPDELYAFSADSPFAAPAYSRVVTGIDFSDAVWLRLGFVNDIRYNWYTDAPDVHRGERDRRFWMGLSRWHIAMPWFMMLRFPADYTGSRLCWRGEMLWPGAKGPYQAVRNGTHGVPHAHARGPSASRSTPRRSSRARWPWCCTRRRRCRCG